MRISDWSSDVALPISQRRRADRTDHPGDGGRIRRSRTGAGDPPLPDRVVRHRRGGAGVVPGTSGAAWIATIRVTPRRARPPSTHRLQKEERPRSEEHTSELQSLMRISYAVFCLKKN